MSAATPDHVCRAIWNNARGIGSGPAVTAKEWKTYALDLGAEFTYWGEHIEIRAESIGGGMYRLKGTRR